MRRIRSARKTRLPFITPRTHTSRPSKACAISAPSAATRRAISASAYSTTTSSRVLTAGSYGIRPAGRRLFEPDRVTRDVRPPAARERQDAAFRLAAADQLEHALDVGRRERP